MHGAIKLYSSLDVFLFKRGLWLLFVFAASYYYLYHNAHLTLTGEAGSNVLIAQRINEGWRPIKDMFIGYNVMWFYPLSWIFEYTGPHLLASRIYFMAVSIITGLLGFALVRKVTTSGILAAVAGTLMVLMPGAMYRNNVAFVATLASFALVYGYVVKHRTGFFQILWMAFAGAAMSLCFLIRIEPSLIASVVWVGLVILYPIGIRKNFFPRLWVVVMGTILGACAFVFVHAPFVYQAYQRGFGPEFTGQYLQFVNLLSWELKKEIDKIQPAFLSKKNAPPLSDSSISHRSPAVAKHAMAQKTEASASSSGFILRPPLFDSLQRGRVSFFPLALYFPIFASVVLTVAGTLFLIGGIACGSDGDRQSGLAILVATGCSLSLFPQYFFFRPDSVHLAEFMVPFYPALACGAAAAVTLLKWNRWFVLCGGIIFLFVCLQVIVAFNALFGREGSGSIRMARGRSALFEAPGGIHFRVKPDDLADWEELRDILFASTREGDFLVTYPYVPLLNVMSQRPTYQFKLYVDNATEAEDFPEKTVRELREKRPAVVVVNNRDINKTEHSRFENWAAPVHRFLEENYVFKGPYLKNIWIFVRPDRAAEIDSQSR